jgi:hypothetical protein
MRLGEIKNSVQFSPGISIRTIRIFIQEKHKLFTLINLEASFTFAACWFPGMVEPIIT